MERSQPRWYGYVTRISCERTAKQLMDALPVQKAYFTFESILILLSKAFYFQNNFDFVLEVKL